MEFSSNGLTAWYGTSDAPAPPENGTVDRYPEITVGVAPALPSNTVTILYRENGGVEHSLRATLSRTDFAARKQYFRAALPVFSPGAKIEYQPVVVSGGRRFTTPAPFPSSVQISNSAPGPDPASNPVRLTSGGRPYSYRTDYLTRMSIQLQQQLEVIGNTPDGLRVDFLVQSGSLEGKIAGVFHPSGGDWMRIRTDGVGITDIRTTIQADDGALILMEASGMVDFGENGFSLALSGRFPKSNPVVLTPRFLTSDARYLWLNRLQCIGLGYADTVALQVHYDIYAIHLQSGHVNGEQ